MSISFLIRVLDESTAATAVFRAADDCFMLRVSRLLPDLFDADARARRLRAQFPSLLHLSASFLRQLRRRGYEWVLALLRRAELHQVHFVRLLLQQLLDVCVPLIGELDLLRPGRGELGLPLEVLGEFGWALPGVSLVDAEHASILACERCSDTLGCIFLLSVLLAVRRLKILLV